MAEEQKNYFNILNLIGAAFVGASAISLADLLAATEPLLGTLILGAVAVVSFGLIRYDSNLKANTTTGITVGFIFIISTIMAGFSGINLISAELGFATVEAVDNIREVAGRGLATMAVGVVLFSLGEVFEE